MKFDHVAPLQGWSRHLGHSWSRKEYPGGPEKCWHITCFEPEIFFWKMRGMFSQLLTKKATWQKSTSVPILVMQCSISDIVSTRRSWLHLDIMDFFYFFVMVFSLGRVHQKSVAPHVVDCFFPWPGEQLVVLEHSMCRHYLKSSLFAKTSRDSWAKICHCKKVTIIDLCNQNGR